MNATTKFYTGVVIVLALIVALSYEIGYHVGAAHASAQHIVAHKHAQTP